MPGREQGAIRHHCCATARLAAPPALSKNQAHQKREPAPPVCSINLPYGAGTPTTRGSRFGLSPPQTLPEHKKAAAHP